MHFFDWFCIFHRIMNVQKASRLSVWMNVDLCLSNIYFKDQHSSGSQICVLAAISSGVIRFSEHLAKLKCD